MKQPDEIGGAETQTTYVVVADADAAYTRVTANEAKIAMQIRDEEEAMLVLSGRWPTLLLYYMQHGTKRFGELRKDNPTISHRMLTHELRKLEAAGVVVRTSYDGYPSRVDYCLSPAGRRLLPLVDAIGDWWSETQAERKLPSQADTLDSGAKP
jgi:DNA-binding HxlR family transcriptional regulator